jgi:ADP-dependent NAD(P)H-hydrate dehydratase
MAARTEVVTASLLRDWPLPQPTGSKSSRGRIVVVGGSPAVPGAAMLAGVAALRVGAGVLSLAVAASVAGPVAAAVPEASVTGLPQLDGAESGDDTLASAVDGADALLVGPGLDDPEVAERIVRGVLAEAGDATPLVLDAFALGVLPGIGVDVGGRVVLTPNSSEARRLLEADDLGEEDSTEVARAIADRYGAVVSYGNHLAAPDGRSWIVPSGHVGLGTSGSGDVLAGAVAGLVARGAELGQAACWGTYLHATAGDRLAARVGRLGFLARELVEELPYVIVETEA